MSNPQKPDRSSPAAQLRAQAAQLDQGLRRQIEATSEGNPELRALLSGLADSASAASEQLIARFEDGRTT